MLKALLMATNFDPLNTLNPPHSFALCQQNSNFMLIWDYYKLHFSLCLLVKAEYFLQKTLTK